MFEIAGAVGICPFDCTLRQLTWMAKGRYKLEWSTASAILAKIHNIMSDRPKSPSEFNPMIEG